MFMTKAARISKRLYCTLWLIGCVLYSSAHGVLAQKQTSSDKPWREVVSTEGRFRVLLPDTPSELFIPVPGQILKSDVRVYAVNSPVALYAVLFGDLPEDSKDPEVLQAAFDNGRDRALSEGKLRLISEKDISKAGLPGREYVMDDGAFMIRNRVYFNKGRLYEVIFAGPGPNGTPTALDQYYDGLAAKFFSSFKIGS